MYLSKEQIEVKIFEALDDTIFYNGKRLDEILPIEERALICVNIMENLPPTLPDIITKYHKDITTLDGDNINTNTLYKHLLEEVLELGMRLNIPINNSYFIILNMLSELYKKENIVDRELLISQLSKVSIIIGEIADIAHLDEILYDAILITRDSLNNKICSLEEVKQTIEEKGLSNSPSIRTKNLGNDKYLIIDEDTGKSIKPVGFKPPDFKHLFK